MRYFFGCYIPLGELMRIAVFNEAATYESRVALTPDAIKKLGGQHSVIIEEGAGIRAGFSDDHFDKVGADIAKAKDCAGADVVVHVAPLTAAQLKLLKSGTITVGVQKPHYNQDAITMQANQGLTSFAMELIPRISRAQSMDMLSSQSNLAGYKAVIDAVAEFDRAIPMMMTAAGTIPPAKMLIIGAGVAGLQAIATAKRLGAVVTAYDVRPEVKEQVESLGGKFLEVDSEESGEASGGYAKEMSAEYKKAQAAKLAEAVPTQDIVITTAQIPGRSAPKLITAEMLKQMQSGSVIIDMAVETGGNCAYSQLGKTINQGGVKIIGPANLPARLPRDASQVFARNIISFMQNLHDEKGQVRWDDEIVSSSVLTHEGKVVHPQFKG